MDLLICTKIGFLLLYVYDESGHTVSIRHLPAFFKAPHYSKYVNKHQNHTKPKLSGAGSEVDLFKHCDTLI